MRRAVLILAGLAVLLGGAAGVVLLMENSGRGERDRDRDDNDDKRLVNKWRDRVDDACECTCICSHLEMTDQSGPYRIKAIYDAPNVTDKTCTRARELCPGAGT